MLFIAAFIVSMDLCCLASGYAKLSHEMGRTVLASELVSIPIPPHTKPQRQLMSKRGGVEMIAIPAGKFTMGSDDTPNEKPVRKVYLDAYTIGKNLVTVKQFKVYCAEQEVSFNKFKEPKWGWIDDHPMVNISWEDARAFCKWAGGDLPTEAQWEKASRGTDGREFPWGNAWNNLNLWCSFGTYRSGTNQVGSRPAGASPYGCLDMSGNAAQWCLDLYGSYAGLPDRNPIGARDGDSRVIRGGSWLSSKQSELRSAHRDDVYTGVIFETYGFRLSGPAAK